uniref:DUF3742 domain-containing protein n=1 Tax=Candidatus Nitrotoga fabula TaxID=2182327 RepID=A0A2X0QS24_9PROT|nr:conserved protein of unknown function [Candidatus Nitrotoga fabula]
MKHTAHPTTAERAGRWLGSAWRGFVRKEACAVQWLAGKGLPAGVVRLLFWVAKLVVVAVLLYSAFWLALLLVFAVTAAWLVRNADLDDEKQPELRDGHSGIGWYNKDDLRIDMGDPDDP